MRSADTPATKATRDRIVAGARVVLTERGIRESTVKHVLEESGVSRRTFYQYFRSLDDLLLFLYRDFTDEMVAGMRAGMEAEADPISQVKAAIAAYLDVEQREGALLIPLQAEAIRSDSLLAPRRKAVIDDMVGLLDQGIVAALGVRLDLLLLRSMLLAVEGAVISVQAQGTFDAADRLRVELIARSIFLHTLAGWENLPRREAEPDSSVP